MHVGIDEAWKNGRVPEVMDVATLCGDLIERNNGLDALSLCDDGCRADPFGRNHSTGPESMRTQDIYLLGKLIHQS
jgi:hypothetical protein